MQPQVATKTCPLRGVKRKKRRQVICHYGSIVLPWNSDLKPTRQASGRLWIKQIILKNPRTAKKSRTCNMKMARFYESLTAKSFLTRRNLRLQQMLPSVPRLVGDSRVGSFRKLPGQLRCRQPTHLASAFYTVLVCWRESQHRKWQEGMQLGFWGECIMGLSDLSWDSCSGDLKWVTLSGEEFKHRWAVASHCGYNCAVQCQLHHFPHSICRFGTAINAVVERSPEAPSNRFASSKMLQIV